MSLLPFPDDEELARAWYGLRDEIVPYLGERAVDLFSYALADSAGATALAAGFRAVLEAGGDDPEGPQVTDAEQLLIDWAHAVGAAPAAVPAALSTRMAETFQPRLRSLLNAFAAQSSGLAVLSLLAGDGR